MKRTYVPTRMRARRSARRIVSRRAALGRFVPILDDDRYAVGSEIEDWVDAQAQAGRRLADGVS